MKILYYADVDLSMHDGKAVNEMTFCRSAAHQMGQDVFFVLPPQSRALSFIQTDVQCLTVDLPPLKTIGRHIWACWKEAGRLVGFMGDNQIDLFVTRLPFFPLIPLFMSLKGVPVAVKTLHNYRMPYSDDQKISHKILGFFNLWVNRWVIRRSSVVDCALSGLVEIEKERAKNQTVFAVIDNAIPTETFIPQDHQQDWPYPFDYDAFPVLGFAGTQPSKRGVSQMVEVAARLRPDFPNIAIVVAGQDDALDRLKDRSEELGISDRCFFYGHLDPEMMPDFFSLMDIGFSFYEDLFITKLGSAGQKVRQYMSCGKPVITSAGEPSHVVSNPWVAEVDHNDLDQIEKAVRCYADALHSRKTEIAEDLHHFSVEHFSANGIMEKRLALWEMVLKEVH